MTPTTVLPINLVLTLEPPEAADLESVDQGTRFLLADLRASQGAVDVELHKGDPGPTDAKSAEAITIGALALAVLPTMLPRLVEALQAWSLRWRDYRIRIKRQVGDKSFELDYAPAKTSAEELQRLVEVIAHAFPDQLAPEAAQSAPKADPPSAKPS